MATTRKTGKLGALYLGTTLTSTGIAVKVADVFDWTFESQAEVFECSIKEEQFDRYQPGGGNARLTVQGYVTALAKLSNQVLNSLSATGAGTRAAWKLAIISTDATAAATINPAGNQVWQGFGWVTRGTMTAPRGMIVDTFEIQIDGEWQNTTSTGSES